MWASATVLAAELVDTPGGVYNLLFARVEGVASGTDFDVYVPPQGGAGSKLVTAAARDLDIVVLGVDSFFHFNPSRPSIGEIHC